MRSYNHQSVHIITQCEHYPFPNRYQNEVPVAVSRLNDVHKNIVILRYSNLLENIVKLKQDV